jgi:hypothetical protein
VLCAGRLAGSPGGSCLFRSRAKTGRDWSAGEGCADGSTEEFGTDYEIRSASNFYQQAKRTTRETNTRKSIRDGLNLIDIDVDIDAILEIGDTGHGDNLDVRFGSLIPSSHLTF